MGAGVNEREIAGGSNRRFAPYESCFGCFKGDTVTALGFHGEAEWIMALLGRLGVPEAEVNAFIHMIAVEDYGCQQGFVPDRDMMVTFRMCAECAVKAGMEVRRLPEIALYPQPDETREVK